MTFYDNSRLFAPGMTANTYMGNDWAFRGSTALEPIYEGNFEADIDAIAESIGDDSGYYSNDAESSEIIKHDFVLYDDNSSTDILDLETAGSVSEQRRFYPDAAASNKSNQDSIGNDTVHKSTTNGEKSISHKKQPKETWTSKTLYHPVHEYEHGPAHKYSTIKIETGDHQPLDNWEATYHRHEWIAYQLEQRVKGQSPERRTTGSKK